MANLNKLMEEAPDNILREFARKCALRHIEKIKPYCSEKDYELIAKWIKTGDESIREAADSAAYSAAYWAARSANSAYWAAISAAYWTAYWAAYWATDLAEEREWQEQTLLEMMGVVMTNQTEWNGEGFPPVGIE